MGALFLHIYVSGDHLPFVHLAQVLTASHEEGAQGPLVKELKEIAPEAYDARVRSTLDPPVRSQRCLQHECAEACP